jgi:hypothetical protein
VTIPAVPDRERSYPVWARPRRSLTYHCFAPRPDGKGVSSLCHQYGGFSETWEVEPADRRTVRLRCANCTHKYEKREKRGIS